jgi:predicted  nucleic acid-binding Zn ribbon protein
MGEPKKCPKCGNKTWILSQDVGWKIHLKCAKCGYEGFIVISIELMPIGED